MDQVETTAGPEAEEFKAVEQEVAKSAAAPPIAVPETVPDASEEAPQSDRAPVEIHAE